MPNNNKKVTKKKTTQNTEKTDNKKGKNRNKKKMNPKLKLVIRLIIILILLLCVAGAGVVAAICFGFFGDDFEITKDELTVGASNSVILDKNGNEIANLSEDEKRKVISISEMAPYLPKAYVAIEDKRFYNHNGVDIKRTAGAILGVITKNSSYGGSSITQQLVKNVTNDKARSGIEGVMRKVKEWSKAIQVERMISKDQILELYLNIIFVGGENIHGVELGANYYFNKTAKDLDLAECAFLAGINNSPNAYNPFDTEKDRTDLIKERTLVVLDEMKNQKLIENDEDYNTAVAKVKEGLPFTKGSISTNSTYSYHTDATINQVIDQVMEEKNISRELARNYVYSSGLTIYSTEDPTIQKTVEEEFAKTKYQIKGREKNKDGNLKNEHTQAAMVIIDHTTGQVVAVGGKLGEQYATGWNRGTQMIRQTGSSMKPLADVVPGLQEKVITAATIYDDILTDFKGYKPGDWNTPRGLINIRQCISTSQNIPMVKIMAELSPAKSLEYLRKMGISTLDDTKDAGLSLSIGGLRTGISPLEMAGAYAAIANDGVYITPTFYTKVVDDNGNTVLAPTQEKTRVISEQNAYIARSIMQEPVTGGGTATFCKVQGMETCAKTGSTDEYKDRWLCGMTPYYATACWWGFDEPEPLKYANGTVYSVDGRNPAGQLWSTVMKSIHKDLPNKNFNKPSGLVSQTICKVTGCIATSTCKDTYSEIFTPDNLPTKCEGHGIQSICKASGHVANEYCPKDQVEEVAYGGVIPKETLGLWKPVGASGASGKTQIEDVCTIHTKPAEEPKPEIPSEPNDENQNNNTVEKPPENTTTDPSNTTDNNNTTVEEPTGNTTEDPKEPTGDEKDPGGNDD